MFDDYVEHDAAALDILQRYLNKGVYKSHGALSGGSSSHAGRRRGSGSNSNYDRAMSDPIGQRSTQNRPLEHRSGYQSTSAVRNGQYIEVEGESTSTLHLLYCTSSSRNTFNLHQDVLEKVADDKSLFAMLKRHYLERRGQLRRYWSLKTLRNIHFAQVSHPNIT
jgi:hypothetical protein